MKTLDRDTFIRLKKLRPWISFSYIFCVYALIFSICFIAQSLSWYFWFPLLLIVGGLQHHLMTFIHEGAHGNLLVQKKANDFWTDVLVGIPFFTLVRQYRFVHQAHHRLSGQLDDPERSMYNASGYNYNFNGKKALLVTLIKDLLGYSFVKSAVWMGGQLEKRYDMGSIAKPGSKDLPALLLCLTLLSSPVLLLQIQWSFLILWFGGLFAAQFFLRLHGYGEHTGDLSDNQFEVTVTHDFMFLTKFFLYPINSHLHLEHHIYPTIPWYNLRELRSEAMKDIEYREGAGRLTSDGYFWGRKSILKLVFGLK